MAGYAAGLESLAVAEDGLPVLEDDLVLGVLVEAEQRPAADGVPVEQDVALLADLVEPEREPATGYIPLIK